jgi:hypothetical protein
VSAEESLNKLNKEANVITNAFERGGGSMMPVRYKMYSFRIFFVRHSYYFLYI